MVLPPPLFSTRRFRKLLQRMAVRSANRRSKPRRPGWASSRMDPFSRLCMDVAHGVISVEQSPRRYYVIPTGKDRSASLVIKTHREACGTGAPGETTSWNQVIVRRDVYCALRRFHIEGRILKPRRNSGHLGALRLEW